jgi:hypothetical protein
MPARRRILALAALALAVLAPGVASAASAALPLGPPGLPETRSVRVLAPGVTLTEIVRGTASPQEAFVVDAGFSLDAARTEQTAARARALGLAATVIAVDDHAPDNPLPGPTAFLARIGRFATEDAAAAVADRLRTAGVDDATVDLVGEDGTPATTGPWRVHVLEVDPGRFRGTVAPVLANGVVTRRETVTAIDRRTRALAGVNGGYFTIGTADGTPGDPAGLSVVGGELVSEAVDGRTDLVLGGGRARIMALSNDLRARSSDGARRLVDGRNRRPGLIRACGGDGGDRPTDAPLHDITCTDPSELVQITPRFGARTPPGARVEAVIGPDGRVRALRTRRGGIPRGGSVLLGTGDGASWLRAHARPGRRVRVTARVTIAGGGTLALRAGTGVVNGGPRLLAGGAPAIDATAEGFVHPGDPEFLYRFGVRRNPRTMAGVTRAGRLLLVAVDGGAPGYSVGLTFAEEAAVMASLGAVDATNLDGGGSTTLALGARQLTRPSDPTGERPVGDAIVVLPRPSP